MEALDYIQQNPNTTFTKAGELYGVDRHTLSSYKNVTISADNLFTKPNDDKDFYLFSDEELELVEYYKTHSKNSYTQIKKKYPNTPQLRTLRRWMDIIGYNYYKGYHQKYSYDRNKFNTIDTEEDAYWLGFITADGCLLRNRTLQISLGYRDKSHLEKFCKFMGMNELEIQEAIKFGIGGAYTRDNKVSIIKINSVQVFNNLLDKGLTPKKSTKEKPYICKTKELELAYIRGLIDGDGYISNNNNNYGFGICGSYDICKYVYDFINNNVEDITTISVHNKGKIYDVSFRRKALSAKFLNLLYENATIYLDRKYEIYKKRYKDIAVYKSQN